MFQPIGNTPDQIAGKLITHLKSVYPDYNLEYAVPLTQLKGGIETATYQFQIKGGPQELNQPLILRLYPEKRGAEDAVWESSVQNALSIRGYPVARAHNICADKAILGGAFYLMEFLPGQPLWNAPFDTISDLLGKTHADLHKIDPEPLVQSLRKQGFNENWFHFRTDFFAALIMAAKDGQLPWTRAMLDWLQQNRPPEPEQMAICHGDFHPLNILLQDGKVSGVLDWHLSIADPVLDVANTIRLISMVQHFSIPGAEAIDWEAFIQKYLAAYRSQLPLDLTHLDYYRVLQNLVFIFDNGDRQALQIPSLIKATLEFIHKVTGIQITINE